MRLACFVKNEFQMLSTFLALRSLQSLKLDIPEPLVFVPTSISKLVDEKYGKFNLKGCIRKLGGDYREGFAKGYNERNALRPGFGNIARIVGNEPILYFAPSTFFYSDPRLAFDGSPLQIARAPDDYWPNLELYGPSLEKIWGQLAKFSEVDLEPWLEHSHPKSFWRRYPRVTSRLFFVDDATKWSVEYNSASKDIIGANIPEFDGQSRDLVEAAMAIVLMRNSGKIAELAWDTDMQSFDSFPQLVLRMPEDKAEWFHNEILEFPVIRKIFKQNIELKFYFYNSPIYKLKDRLDEIERDFGMQRMNQLIERRNVERAIAHKVRKAKERLEAQDAQAPTQ